MEIPTRNMQMKIAELLHNIGCADKPTTHEADRPQDCLDWPKYVVDSAFFLGKLMPSLSKEIYPAIRADERDRIAYHIRAELVCCDISERMDILAGQATWDESKHEWTMPKAWYDLKKSSDYHAICYYGGWAATLAAKGPEFDHRKSTFPEGCCEPGCGCRG